MTVMDECADCGTEMGEFTSEQYKDGIYLCEDYYCPCGSKVGGFAFPIHV